MVVRLVEGGLQSFDPKQTAKGIFTPKKKRRGGGGSSSRNSTPLPTAEETRQRLIETEKQAVIEAERQRAEEEFQRAKSDEERRQTLQRSTERIEQIQQAKTLQSREEDLTRRSQISGFQVEQPRNVDDSVIQFLGGESRGFGRTDVKQRSFGMQVSDSIDEADKFFSPIVTRIIAPTFVGKFDDPDKISDKIQRFGEKQSNTIIRSGVQVSSGVVSLGEKGLEKPFTTFIIGSSAFIFGGALVGVAGLGTAGAVSSQVIGGSLGGVFLFAKTGEALRLRSADEFSRFAGRTAGEFAFVGSLARAGARSIDPKTTITKSQRADIKRAIKTEPEITLSLEKGDRFIFKSARQFGEAKIRTVGTFRVVDSKFIRGGVGQQRLSVGGKLISKTNFQLGADPVLVKAVSNVKIIKLLKSGTILTAKTDFTARFPQIQTGVLKAKVTTFDLKRFEVTGGAFFKQADKGLTQFLSFNILKGSKKIKLTGAGLSKKLSSPKINLVSKGGGVSSGSKSIVNLGKTIQLSKTITKVQTARAGLGLIPKIQTELLKSIKIVPIRQSKTLVSPFRLLQKTKTLSVLKTPRNISIPGLKQAQQLSLRTKQKTRFGSASGLGSKSINKLINRTITIPKTSQISRIGQGQRQPQILRTPNLTQLLNRGGSRVGVPRIRIDIPKIPKIKIPNFNLGETAFPDINFRPRKRKRRFDDLAFAQDLTAKVLNLKPIKIKAIDIPKIRSKPFGIRRGIRITK